MVKHKKHGRFWIGRHGWTLGLLVGLMALADTQAREARWHVTGASAHVWRGITRHDNLTLGLGGELAAHGFRTHAWGWVRGDELDAMDDQGLIAETELALMYRLPFRAYRLDLGYYEYMYNVGPENTREVFAKMIIPFHRYVDVMALLAYDIGEREDYYVRSGVRVHGDVVRTLTLFAEASMAAAGKGFSLGDEGGAHDYGFRAGFSHVLDPRLRWGLDMQWTGTLDEDVLPEQRVVSWLTVRLAVDL